jgi:hypothetical protein
MPGFSQSRRDGLHCAKLNRQERKERKVSDFLGVLRALSGSKLLPDINLRKQCAGG